MSYNEILKIELSKSSINLSSLENLLENGADPKTSNNSGWNILALAGRNKWSEASYIRLIKTCVATNKLNSSDFSKGLSFYLAYTDTINFEILQAFFNAGADPLIKYNEHTLFSMAAKKGWSAKAYVELIKMSVATKKISEKDFSTALSLYFSYSQSVDFEILQAFFDAGADPKVTYGNGITVLSSAAKNQWSKSSYLNLIKMCLATKKLKDKDFSSGLQFYFSLTDAIDLDILQAFFDAGAHPNTTCSRGYNVFYCAAKKEWSKDAYLRLINMSIATGKLTEKDFSSALSFYLSYSPTVEFEILQAFFTAGANPKTHNDRGLTLFKLAAICNWDEKNCIRLLQLCIATKKLNKDDVAKAMKDYTSHITGSLSLELSQAFMREIDKLSNIKTKSPILECSQLEKLPETKKTDNVPSSQITNNVHPFALKKGLELSSKVDRSPSSPTFFNKIPHSSAPFEISNKKLPVSFYCPITLELMIEPVFCILDRQTYERKPIEEWLSKNRMTPTRVPLGENQKVSDVIFENNGLKDAIEDSKKLYPELFDAENDKTITYS